MPTRIRSALTTVLMLGCVSTRKVSHGTQHRVLTPTCIASGGTTSSYVYHPTSVSVAAGVVNWPEPTALSELCHAGVRSQRIAAGVGKGPWMRTAIVPCQLGSG